MNWLPLVCIFQNTIYNPITIVVRQGANVNSWQIPTLTENSDRSLNQYQSVNRTLCPEEVKAKQFRSTFGSRNTVYITVSTSSSENVSFNLVRMGYFFYYIFKLKKAVIILIVYLDGLWTKRISCSFRWKVWRYCNTICSHLLPTAYSKWPRYRDSKAQVIWFSLFDFINSKLVVVRYVYASYDI